MTRCRDCGRERSSGGTLSLALFVAFFGGGIAVFWLWSPFLGAVIVVGAVSGLLWTGGALLGSRLLEWLSVGR